MAKVNFAHPKTAQNSDALLPIKAGVRNLDQETGDLFLKEFFQSGASLRSGGLFHTFVEHFYGFDLPVFMNVIRLLEKVVNRSVTDLPFLKVPEKLVSAPPVPDIKDVVCYAEQFDHSALPKSLLGHLLQAVVSQPELIIHLSLEERFIVGSALVQAAGTANLPDYATIAAGSGSLELTPAQIGNRVKRAFLMFKKGELENRYANSTLPFRDSQRARLIHKLDAMEPKVKTRYLTELGPDRSFILSLLTGRSRDFQLSMEEMTTLWYYRFGKRTLPPENMLIAMGKGKLPVWETTGEIDFEVAKAGAKEAVLQQLRERLVKNEAPQPLAPEPPDTLGMIRNLAQEYRIKVPVGITTVHDRLISTLRKEGVIIVNGIPVDTETLELLGWLLHNGSGTRPEDLQGGIGYSSEIIAARSAALRAMQERMQHLPLSGRQTELKRIKALLDGAGK